MTTSRRTMLTGPFRAFLSFMMAVLSIQAQKATATRYRLRATSYSMTLSTTLEMKNENCRSNFGEDAALLDMKAAKDMFDSEEEFNEALAAVFFNKPASAFLVLYDGTDTPSEEEHDGKCYAIKTTPPAESSSTIDSFGHARVIVYDHEAQILCAVPTQEETKPMAYVPKDVHDGTKKFVPFSVANMSLLLIVIGAGFLVKRRYSMSNGSAMMPSFTEAYYNVLDSRAHGPKMGGDKVSGELGVNLTEGCELSYNPAVQGLV